MNKKTKKIVFTIIILIILFSVILFKPKHDTNKLFVKVGDPITFRADHMAVLLKDGKVLVTGGTKAHTLYTTKTSELYDPGTKKFNTAGDLNENREDATATLLDDGRVLIVGGIDRSIDAGTIIIVGDPYKSRLCLTYYSAEIYDPKKKKFNFLPNSPIIKYETIGKPHQGPKNLNIARSHHTATKLKDGKVLIVGGISPYGSTNPSELFNPKTNLFYITGSLNDDRFNHQTVLLDNGKVLVVGGSAKRGLTSAELYDPKTGKFTYTGNMHYPRQSFTATKLKDGRVLVVGGEYCRGIGKTLKCEVLDKAEIYDPNTGKFNAPIKSNLQHKMHTATLLKDGRVLILNSFTDNSIELYNPKSNTFTKITNSERDRGHNTATLLQNGDVLIIGGYALNASYLPNKLIKINKLNIN